MKSVLVRRHRRSHRTTEQKVHDSQAVLRRVGHDSDLSAVCWVEPSNLPSQVVAPHGGFREGHCSVVLIEPADMRDEVQRAATLQHEAAHAAQIREHGMEGLGDQNEIEAHRETIRFLQDWKRRRPSSAEREVWCTEHAQWEHRNDRIDEVIAEERAAIVAVEEGRYYG